MPSWVRGLKRFLRWRLAASCDNCFGSCTAALQVLRLGEDKVAQRMVVTIPLRITKTLMAALKGIRNNRWENSMPEPLVSVCIRNFNREKLVSHAIESALSQTYQPLEVIVLDDGSTDGSRDVIARFGDRVRVKFQANQGMTAAG